MLDMRSVFFVQVLVLLVCFVVMFQNWLHNRHRYAGISCWASMMGISCIGYVLMSLRDLVPDLISILLANLLLVSAFALFNRGIAMFYRLKSNVVPCLTAIAAVMLLQTYFTYAQPDIRARIIVISLASAFLYGHALWLLVFRVTAKQRSISKPLIWTVSGIILLNVYRIVIHLFLSSENTGLFDQSSLDNLFLVLQVPLVLFLGFNMVVLVSNSLMMEVKEEEAKFNSIFHSAPYAVVITDAEDATVLEANDEMLKLLEYDAKEFFGKTLLELGTWVDPNQRAQMLAELKDGGTVNGRELQFRSKSGKIFPVLFSASMLNLDGEPCIVSTMKDISDIYRLKNELEDLASHDMLTGLPNRRKFDEICAIQLARASRSGEKLAMVIFDIDDFKCVNDEYGHDVGDKVLLAIADRLRAFSRSAENSARHGGDEFTILLIGLKDRIEVETALMRLYKLYQEPILVEGISFSIGLSMGVAMYPDNGISSEELLRKADKALYEAKRKGKNSICFATDAQ